MKLYFMRHGIAVERGSSAFASDSDRPLTDIGRKKLDAGLRGLAHLDPDWDLILTSPYARARQTAEITAAYFDMSRLLELEPLLEPGHSTSQLIKRLLEFNDLKSMLLVGHEPSLSDHIAACVFGVARGRIEMKKAGLACVEFEGLPKEGHGTLLWLLTPGQMQRLGKKKS